MTSRVIYLARAVDAAGQDAAVVRKIEEVVSDWAAEAGHVVYRPGAAWAVPKVPTPGSAFALCAVNEAARKAADVVVAIVSQTMHSVGVPAEIGASLSEGRRVALIDTSTPSVPPSSYVLVGWTSVQPTFSSYNSTPEQLSDWLDEVI